MSKFRFYEFFAGAGLAKLGLGDPWKCVWANDIDPQKAEIYRTNFEKFYTNFMVFDRKLFRHMISNERLSNVFHPTHAFH